MPLTKFQRLLIDALMSVPPGRVTTFKLIAEAMGDVRAALAIRNECLRLASFAPDVPWWRAVSSNGTPLPGALDEIRKEGGLDSLRKGEFFSDVRAWPVFRIMARDQLALAEKVRLTPLDDAEVAAGVDVSYGPERAVAACVSLDSQMNVLEVRYEEFVPQIPYVPTYLAFRELRGMFPSSMACDFDVLFVDGHGFSHPRRVGEASHLGLLLNRPSIGVAKSKLVGKLVGDRLLLEGEAVATLVRGGYVSPGHLTDVESSVRIALRFWGDGKQPLPLILAHRYSKRFIREH